ncbi:MAG TPA: hypothetical protein PKE05_08750 [Microthrixaceae bacterium]|nr:hypothetical protein [Microthrixaceae bacterium]
MSLPTDAQLAWWAPLAVLRPHVDAPLPRPGSPFRVAFVGQRTYFEVCSQTTPSPVIEPTFIEFRSGADGQALTARLRALAPHIVVVFRPEIIPPGALRDIDALTLGFLTEPLPRDGDGSHADLQRRLQDLAMVDADQFDRVVAFDPHIVGSASRYVPVWRSEPLPVSDQVFSTRFEPPTTVRSLFVGRTTPHRDSWLVAAKHLYDVMHVEHGVFGSDLAELARTFLIAINLHNEPYPSFENRVPLHLAVGNLVISEALSPTNGLDPGLDFLQVDDPDDLVSYLGLVAEEPSRFELVRCRGNLKAEAFRASRVYARLVLDLLLDVAEFGRRPR